MEIGYFATGTKVKKFLSSQQKRMAISQAENLKFSQFPKMFHSLRLVMKLIPWKKNNLIPGTIPLSTCYIYPILLQPAQTHTHTNAHAQAHTHSHIFSPLTQVSHLLPLNKTTKPNIKRDMSCLTKLSEEVPYKCQMIIEYNKKSSLKFLHGTL